MMRDKFKLNSIKLWKIPFIRDDVYGWLDTWYYSGRVAALVPYKRVKNEKNEYTYIPCKPSLHNLIPLFGINFTVLFMLYKNYEIEFLNTQDDRFQHAIMYILAVGESVFVLIQVNVFLFKQKAFLNTFNSLHDVDVLFQKFDVFLSYRLFNYFNIVLTSLAGSSIILKSLIPEKNQDFSTNFCLSISYLGGYIVRQVPLYYYFGVSVNTYVRLRKLHKFMIGWGGKTYDKQQVKQNLHLVSEILMKLCDATDSISCAFPFATLGNITITSITMMLYVFTYFGLNVDRQDEIFVMVLGDVGTTWGILLYLEYFSYESRKTGKILAGLEIPIEDEDIALQRNNILLQIKHRYIEYSAAGLFTLNVQLITQHLNTMSTLIMFLLEMKNQQSE